jgi:hypothetical protein
MPLHNFGRVAPALWRAAQPDLDGFALLHSLPVIGIFKLNNDYVTVEQERRMTPIPVIDAHLSQLSVLFPKVDEVRELARKLNAQLIPGTSLVVHCTHGRDRTGLLIGAWRLLYQGWTIDAVRQEFESFGVTGFLKLIDHQIIECLEEIAHGQ